jgi:1-acyl-sn-glycerol-3-phosphate acyltransferase
MTKLYRTARAMALWTVSGIHFFTVCPLLVLLGMVVDPRKNDWPQRVFCRNVLRLAGARLAVRRAPGFDPARTCIFISNHVNLFDPFVLYSSAPQFIRGLELESHFRIPAYGWMMSRFGNIPVRKAAGPRELRELLRRVRRALDDGISLIVFPEGGRTLDGHVGPFKEGGFRMAIEFRCPIVPVSITGSYEFNRKGSWMLNPSKIVVHLHDPIETRELRKADAPALRDRVRRIIAATVDEALREREENERPRERAAVEAR